VMLRGLRLAVPGRRWHTGRRLLGVDLHAPRACGGQANQTPLV
jgi:hypothetical protein